MQRKGQIYLWPEDPDVSWVLIEDIICEVPQPQVVNNRAQFKVDTSKVSGHKMESVEHAEGESMENTGGQSVEASLVRKADSFTMPRLVA